MRTVFVRLLVLLCSLGGVLALGACHDTTGPTRFDRLYVLRTMYGQPLPYVLYATADGDTTWLVDESITLESSGRATVTSSIRTVVNGGAPTIERSDRPYTYSVAGRRISLQSVCTIDICMIGWRGTISEEQILLFEESAPDMARVYERGTVHATASVAR